MCSGCNLIVNVFGRPIKSCAFWTHFLCVMFCCQLLLQKEREDITALYKSVQPEQSKQNDASNVASASTAQKLASYDSSPPDRPSALQSAYIHPVASDCEFLQERSSPSITAGRPVVTSSVRMAGLTGNHVAVARSHQMYDSAGSLAGAYHSFQSTEDATAVLHQSLDGTFPPVSKSKDLLPQYLKQHSFLNVNGQSAGLLPACTSVGSTVQSSESMNNSVNVQNDLEFKATFAHRRMSDERVHNHADISGINVIGFVYHFEMFMIRQFATI